MAVNGLLHSRVAFVISLILVNLLIDGSNSLDCHDAFTSLAEGYLLSSGRLKSQNHEFAPEHHEAINETHFRTCICTAQRCLRKCCSKGKSYIEGKCRPSNITTLIWNFTNNNHEIVENFTADQFHIVRGKTCNAMFNLDNATYFVTTEGDLRFTVDDDEITVKKLGEFCLENEIVNGEVKEIVNICIVNEDAVNNVLRVGMIISIPFLIATLLVYCWLPELRNLHGKILMSYTFSMLLAFSFYVFRDQEYITNNVHLCVAIACIVQFAFLSVYFWVSAVGFDVYRTFRRGSVTSAARGQQNLKMFLYCLYGWGIPLIIVGSAIIIDHVPNLPEYIIKPEYGLDRCWLKSESANYAYYIGPAATAIIGNMLLFLYTSYKIYKISKETKVLRSTESNITKTIKMKYALYLKLFLVMGISWVMEIISWCVGGDDEFWYATDICNTLQGLFIFIIFVWKKRTKRLIKLKLSTVPWCPDWFKTYVSTQSETNTISTTDFGNEMHTISQNGLFKSKENRY